jgi:hypothetical protein
MKILRWLAYSLLGIIVLLLLLASISITGVDRSPYQQQEYYQEMSARIDSLQLSQNDTASESDFQAGWARTSITPHKTLDLCGYGLRGEFSGIADSLYARAFALEWKNKQVYLLSADLLIMPPLVVKRLNDSLASHGISPEQLYFSATHTHNAPGGWAGGWASRFIAGRYDQEYVDTLCSKFLKCILLARASKEQATVSYGRWDATPYVRNRLNYEDSKIDGWLRALQFTKRSGDKALLVTYAAHANCLAIANHSISADYPGVLVHHLEKSNAASMVCFMAGAVGSHSPATYEKGRDALQARYIGDSLAAIIANGIPSMKTVAVQRLDCSHIPLSLREPHLKISRDYRIRPWLFKLLFGDWSCSIKVLQIGDVLMLGMPCDFSGELMPDLEPLALEKGTPLLVTSFNGGYIGYVNVDKYYDEDRMETRDMNWFGPYNQAYFTEISQRIIRKHGR